MDPRRKWTRVMRGMLYALVIILVLVISLQGHTKTVEQIFTRIRGMWSQNASPQSTRANPASGNVSPTKQFDVFGVRPQGAPPDGSAPGMNALSDNGIGLEADELTRTDSIHTRGQGSNLHANNVKNPGSPNFRTH